jgi:hypothetical protein
MRALFVLGSLSQPYAIDELVQAINQRFDTTVRVNNTYRALRGQQSLFQLEDDMIALSEEGKRWYSVLMKYSDAYKQQRGSILLNSSPS